MRGERGRNGLGWDRCGTEHLGGRWQLTAEYPTARERLTLIIYIHTTVSMIYIPLLLYILFAVFG